MHACKHMASVYQGNLHCYIATYVVVLLCMPQQCDVFIVYNYLLAFLIIIELSIQCMILQISYTNNAVAVVKTLTRNLGNQ